MAVKFKLGQRVVSKKLGLPMVGTVVGVVRGSWWLRKCGCPLELYSWTAVYPGWHEGFVYLVFVEGGQRLMSREEWKRLGMAGCWDTDCASPDSLYYPEEDLEPLED